MTDEQDETHKLSTSYDMQEQITSYDSDDEIDNILIIFFQKYPHLKHKKNIKLLEQLINECKKIFSNKSDEYYLNFIESVIIELTKNCK